jgi:nucleoid DNA-binding protein
MGKKDITARMAKDAGITLQQAQRAFAALLGGIRTSLKSGTKVNLSGFGAAIDIPSKKRVRFNPSRAFKNSL